MFNTQYTSTLYICVHTYGYAQMYEYRLQKLHMLLLGYLCLIVDTFVKSVVIAKTIIIYRY